MPAYLKTILCRNFMELKRDHIKTLGGGEAQQESTCLEYAGPPALNKLNHVILIIKK